MTSMNPLRDNELAAQERIIQLEKELAKKDKLIYKLQNPAPKKPKQPREPINWRWFNKAAKIACIALAALSGLIFLAYLAECNAVYVADASIVSIEGSSRQYSGCQTIIDKDGKIINIPCEGMPGKNTYYTFSFTDYKGDHRTIALNNNYGDSWDRSLKKYLPRYMYTNGDSYDPKVYVDKGEPYVGCKVKLYYLSGQIFKDAYKIKMLSWFKDRSSFDPMVDISMCKKPKAKKPKSVDGRRLNYPIE